MGTILSSPMSPSLNATDRKRLDALHAELDRFRPRNVGYPCNQVFDYSELFRFLYVVSIDELEKKKIKLTFEENNP